MTRKELFDAFDTFLKISKASPTEATAYQTLIQENTTRELIKSVDKLEGHVKGLTSSSRRLELATYVLVALTAILAWLTSKL